MKDTPGSTGAAQLDRVYSKVLRRIVPLLVTAYIVAYLDRVNVSFAKLQMLKDLKLSETAYGLGAGIFFMGYFLLEIPSNLILRRVGARRWIARIMVSWGITSIATMFVSSAWTFCCVRFLLGAAEAGFFPGVIFYLTQWYPASRRAKVTAIFMSGIAICSVIGSLLSGYILNTFDGVSGLSGWQWLFLLEGAPSIIVGLVVLFHLSDGIASAAWLSDEEKSLLLAELAADTRPNIAGSLGAALRDSRVWRACVIYFCIMIGLYGVSFWLPTILLELGVRNSLHIGELTAVPYTFAAIGMVLTARSADRRGERRWHMAVPAASGALGLILGVAFAQSLLAATAALSVATFGILTAAALFWSLPTEYLRGTAAAAGIALINSVGNLAGFVSPYIVGWLKDVSGSTHAGMYFVATCLFMGATLVAVNRPPDRFRTAQFDPPP